MQNSVIFNAGGPDHGRVPRSEPSTLNVDSMDGPPACWAVIKHMAADMAFVQFIEQNLT